ncbi:MAG: quinol:cytochrome c oxidoreductase monoheme cytochrome subunit [Chitinophagaceae bacterium]|nr:quinol:cytochrome c oxidoreductase monoheme cytochrome subunit [Chitinophagaceae bacterium]
MDNKIFRFGTVLIMTVTAFTSCRDKREPGRVYMPDMAYSRAYETYAQNNLKQDGINYINYPVDGTIRRGDLFPYTLPNDSNGYKMAAEVKDPLPALDSNQMLEAQRLFNINCAICHGANMDAQGPLATSGKVGGIANLKLDQYVKEPEGQMFHVVTYGRNNMGSYASQLSRKQRWMVIQYIKSEQAKASANKNTAPAAKDSSSTAKK